MEIYNVPLQRQMTDDRCLVSNSKKHPAVASAFSIRHQKRNRLMTACMYVCIISCISDPVPSNVTIIHHHSLIMDRKASFPFPFRPMANG